MLTETEEKYLQTIPEDKIAVIKPFNPKVKDVARELMRQIQDLLPDVRIFNIGTAELEIAGQNDIDMTVVGDTFAENLATLIKLYGEPVKKKEKSAKWEFVKYGFDVKLYLSTTIQGLDDQIKVFTILKENPDLLKEYESIKLSSNGLPFREYMRKKYEFYHKILGK